jgi:hypothetical protein
MRSSISFVRVLCVLTLLLGVSQTARAETFRPAVPAHPDWDNALKPKGTPGPLLTITDSGKTDYQIVMPETPKSQDRKAAAELAYWLFQMTGVELPFVLEDESFKPTGKEISIGRTKLLADAALPVAEKDLGEEGYAIATKGERLFLIGGSRRGPINAVIALLEEDLGCRWYAMHTATIPSRPNLEFQPVPRTYVPVIKRRDPFYSDAHEMHWALRNRTAAHGVPIPAAWGGYPKFPGHFVHTYNLLMPPEVYFDEHPEYYSLLDGERRPRQLCATNPDVIRIMTEKVLAQLERCPDCRYVDVSPNDWTDYCTCERCRSLDEKEGSPSASLLTLVNAVAEEVAKVRPEVKITTLAYLGTVMPPKTIRPRDNVQIVLCTDSHAWDFLFLAVDETVTFQTAMKAWHEIGANMFVWDYAIDFYRYMRPAPNMDVVQHNMRFFLDHGAEGIFEQGRHLPNWGADRSQLRSWVWAKQMWDLSRDNEPLVRDFYYGFYGAAAEPMYQYDLMLNEGWHRAHARWQEEYPDPIKPDKDEYAEIFFHETVDYSDDFINKAASLFRKARELAKDDPELTRRVEYANLPVMSLQAEQGAGHTEETYDRHSYLELINDFERIALERNVTSIVMGYGDPDINRKLAMWRALALIEPGSVEFRELDNQWKFKPDPENVGVKQKWFEPGLDDSNWGSVRSDLGHRGWESQGFGEYTVGYGWYRQSFDLPEDILEYPNLRLFFPAVDEQAEVWINGRKALSHTADVLGLSKDFLWNKPFIFDPKQYLEPGETNQLTVRVHNALHVGGIYKPVWFVWGQPVRDLDVLDRYLIRQKEYLLSVE